MKGLRLPVSIPHPLLPSRHGTAPALWGFALVDARGPSTSLGLGLPEGPCRRLGAEIDGISQVPREPWCAFALLSDPGRIAPTKPVQWVEVVSRIDLSPRFHDDEGSRNLALFRGSITQLLHSLSTLRAAIADDDARLASGGWLALTGWE